MFGQRLGLRQRLVQLAILDPGGDARDHGADAVALDLGDRAAGHLGAQPAERLQAGALASAGLDIGRDGGLGMASETDLKCCRCGQAGAGPGGEWRGWRARGQGGDLAQLVGIGQAAGQPAAEQIDRSLEPGLTDRRGGLAQRLALHVAGVGGAGLGRVDPGGEIGEPGVQRRFQHLGGGAVPDGRGETVDPGAERGDGGGNFGRAGALAGAGIGQRGGDGTEFIAKRGQSGLDRVEPGRKGSGLGGGGPSGLGRGIGG